MDNRVYTTILKYEYAIHSSYIVGCELAKKRTIMIKKLIKDLAFDNITLSQGLTRAKHIENQVKNKTFKNWLKKEPSPWSVPPGPGPHRPFIHQSFKICKGLSGQDEKRAYNII